MIKVKQKDKQIKLNKQHLLRRPCINIQIIHSHNWFKEDSDIKSDNTKSY